jgi:hypothetical protein
LKFEIVAIGAVAVVGAYLLSKHHAAMRHRQLSEHVKPVEQIAKDVYSGDWVSPYERPFPYQIAPHRDPHTGKLVSQHDPFPSQHVDKAENFIIDKIVQEFTAQGRLASHMATSLHTRIRMDYMREIAHIAKMNKFKLKPLHGRASSEYASLVLRIAQNHSLYLSRGARARYEAQTFYIPEAHHIHVNHFGATNAEDE